MTYVAQIVLGEAEAAQRRLLGLYEWHKVAWEMYPNCQDDKRGFLTRLDVKRGEFRFTILSTQKPQKPKWCADASWKETELPPSFFGRNQYLFQILANPTRTLSRRDPKGNKKENGSHYAITQPAELRAWFLKKGDQHGFEVLGDPVMEISQPVFHKLYKVSLKPKSKYEGLIIGVEFKGALEVKDKDKFTAVIHEGIGRGRGFGFGMFVLRPLV